MNALTQIGHRLVRRIRRHHDHFPLARQARDRRHLRKAHRRLVEDDAADHHHAADHHGVRIALRRVDELREADGARGAALVVELHAGNQLGALHRGGEVAAGLVPAAAGVGRDHHLQARLRGGSARGERHGQREKKTHGKYLLGKWASPRNLSDNPPP